MAYQNPFIDALSKGADATNKFANTALKAGSNAISAMDSAGSIGYKIISLLNQEEATRQSAINNIIGQMTSVLKQQMANDTQLKAQEMSNNTRLLTTMMDIQSRKELQEMENKNRLKIAKLNNEYKKQIEILKQSNKIQKPVDVNIDTFTDPKTGQTFKYRIDDPKDIINAMNTAKNLGLKDVYKKAYTQLLGRFDYDKVKDMLASVGLNIDKNQFYADKNIIKLQQIEGKNLFTNMDQFLKLSVQNPNQALALLSSITSKVEDPTNRISYYYAFMKPIYEGIKIAKQNNDQEALKNLNYIKSILNKTITNANIIKNIKTGKDVKVLNPEQALLASDVAIKQGNDLQALKYLDDYSYLKYGKKTNEIYKEYKIDSSIKNLLGENHQALSRTLNNIFDKVGDIFGFVRVDAGGKTLREKLNEMDNNQLEKLSNKSALEMMQNKNVKELATMINVDPIDIIKHDSVVAHKESTKIFNVLRNDNIKVYKDFGLYKEIRSDDGYGKYYIPDKKYMSLIYQIGSLDQKTKESTVANLVETGTLKKQYPELYSKVYDMAKSIVKINGKKFNEDIKRGYNLSDGTINYYITINGKEFYAPTKEKLKEIILKQSNDLIKNKIKDILLNNVFTEKNSIATRNYILDVLSITHINHLMNNVSKLVKAQN